MEIKANSSSIMAGRAANKWRLALTIGFFFVATFIEIPHALSLDKERNATVNAGEKVSIWFGANYGRRCATAGPPVFNLTSKPSLGEVETEQADYTVPSGENCGGKTYTGLRIWYKAGPKAGTDTFAYTIEFPHEASNPAPSKGPQPVSVNVTVR
jgi:hypothetical protein